MKKFGLDNKNQSAYGVSKNMCAYKELRYRMRHKLEWDGVYTGINYVYFYFSQDFDKIAYDIYSNSKRKLLFSH